MELALFGILVVGALVCAALALRASRLMVAALWLAVSSALLAALFYVMGAPEIGVIELSVGAGLVTVLLVFAISVAGNEPQDMRPLLPRSVVWVLTLAAFGLLAWQVLPVIPAVKSAVGNSTFSETLWQQRGLDVLVQIVIIFAGVLGFLGLLSPELKAAHPPHPALQPHAAPASAKEERA
jgi:uncharacterized MnhB-related membrane protein